MRKEVGLYGSYARTFILNVRQCFAMRLPVLLPIRSMVLLLMCSWTLLILPCRNCLLYRNMPMSYGEQSRYGCTLRWAVLLPLQRRYWLRPVSWRTWMLWSGYVFTSRTSKSAPWRTITFKFGFGSITLRGGWCDMDDHNIRLTFLKISENISSLKNAAVDNCIMVCIFKRCVAFGHNFLWE